MESHVSSEAAHVVTVLTAAQRSRHDPDADLALMLGELEGNGDPNAEPESAAHKDLGHILTRLARDARTD